MASIHGAIAAIYLTQLLITLQLVNRSGERGPAIWLFQGLMSCCFLYLCYPLFPRTPELEFFAIAFSFPINFMPISFWLLCNYLFNDHFKLRWYHIALSVICVALPPIGQYFMLLVTLPTGLIADGFNLLFFRLPQFLEFPIILWALWITFSSWQEDLVEQRLKLRFWLLGSAGFFILVVIVTQQILRPDSLAFNLLHRVLLVVYALAINLSLIRLAPTIPFFTSTNSIIPPLELSPKIDSVAPAIESSPQESDQVGASLVKEIDTESQATLDKLTQLMEQDQAFLRQDLTIGILAEMVGIPAYRLRALINAQLGFRNFNDYVNRYRVQEASTRLTSSEHSHLPILTIALDSGFRSISSFNKAFKELTGVTPTQYRQNNTKDSIS